MERLFSTLVESAPGHAAAAPLNHPSLMMLRSKFNAKKDPGALVRGITARFDVDDESSAAQTLAFLASLAVERVVPPADVDELLAQLMAYANAHPDWPDALRWVCAIAHFYCEDVLAIAQLEESGALDVIANALGGFAERPEVALSACTFLQHFPCATHRPGAMHGLRRVLAAEDAPLPLLRLTLKNLANATTVWSPNSDPAPLIDAFVGTDAAGILALAALMQGSMSTGEDLQLCMRALANLAVSSREAGRAPVVTVVLDALMQNGGSEDLASQVLSYIANGSSQQDVQTSRVLETVLAMVEPAIARASAGSTRILADVVHTLGSLATHWKDSKARMAQSGVVDRLLFVMATYVDDATLQQQCCNLLSYLCFDSENITSTVTRNGGVALVLQAMAKFRGNEQLLTAACAAVSGLTFNNPAGQLVVREVHAVPLILDILRSAKRPRLVEMACLALGTLCWNVDLKTAIAEAGGVDLVVGSLDKFAGSSGVVKNACRALAQIAFNSEKYRDEMTQRGAIRLIIKGMSQHPQHDRAQLHACAALSYLSWTSPTNAADILQHDGYKAIIRAMAHNLPNHEVQEHACRALANINGPPLTDTEPALQAIVDAMNRHERIAEVQEEACRAIVTLALASPENKTRLHERNVSQAVVAALRRFSTTQLVQQEAANAIAHLAYEHPDLNRTITELDSVSLLVSAMRAYPANTKLQLNACGGLSALAFNNPTAQRQVSDLGGVPLILKAMREIERVRLLELGCSLLGTLAWNPEIKEKVATACVPTIIATMRNHADNACLQKATIRAAAQFAFDSEANRQLLFESDAVQLIIKALKAHMANTKLVGHALVALTYMCWENGAIASAIMDSEALSVVEEVIRMHSSCDRVANRAQHLRRILQRRTPVSEDAPPFPASPLLPYANRSTSSFSPPGSPTTPGHRHPRGNRFSKEHSPMMRASRNPSFSDSMAGSITSLPGGNSSGHGHGGGRRGGRGGGGNGYQGSGEQRRGGRAQGGGGRGGAQGRGGGGGGGNSNGGGRGGRGGGRN